MTQSNNNLAGKVCLITGATSGIGKAIAQALVDMGATIVIVGRDPEKTASVARQLNASNGSSAKVDSLLADLSVMGDVRRLAEEFKARYNRLDALFNNAGAVYMARQESADGIELSFALNHLSVFLLTNLLLDVLQTSAPARIVHTSSQLQQRGSIDFNDLEYKQRPYNGFAAYGSAKLANLMFNAELARRLNGTGVTTNAFHPGVVGSHFAQNNGGVWRIFFSLIRPLLLKPEQGADTGVWLATAPENASVNGGYFSKRTPIQPQSIANDADATARLWTISEEMTGLNVRA